MLLPFHRHVTPLLQSRPTKDTTGFVSSSCHGAYCVFRTVTYLGYGRHGSCLQHHFDRDAKKMLGKNLKFKDAVPLV